MQAVLETQQAAQLQLTVILKRHRPSKLLRANLDKQLANMARQVGSSAAAFRLADDAGEQLPTNARETDGQVPNITSTPVEPGAGNGDLRSDLSSAKDDTPKEMLSSSMPLAVIIKFGTSLGLLLVAIVSAGLALFFYVSLPGVSPHREVAADIAAPLSHPPAVPGILPDGRQPGESATAAQPPVTPVLAPPSPTLSNDAERFVPVVFTHKDKGTALRAFAELQRRYPKLMARRQSELQSVDTGKNGIWYRLVVLPAGPHQEASEICGRLQAAGHNRCWVKPY